MSDDFNARLRKKIMATFEQEAKERLQAITSSLLSLENNPPAEEASSLLNDIFREAHTLKGSARGLDLEDVGKIAHKLENVFSRVQTGALKHTAALFDAVYRALDDMGALVQAAATDTAPGVDVPAICKLLEQLIDPSGAVGGAHTANGAHEGIPAVQAAPAVPTPAEPAPPTVSTNPRASRSSIRRAELLGPKAAAGTGINLDVVVTEIQATPEESKAAPSASPVASATTARHYDSPPAQSNGVHAADASASAPEPEPSKLSEYKEPDAKEPDSAESKKELAPKAGGIEVRRGANEETVRVAISKLDSLMAQVGEIQVTRVSNLRRLNEIGATLEMLETWDADWCRMRTDCREVLRELIGDDSGRPEKSDVPRNLPAYLRNSEGRLKMAISQMNALKRNVRSDGRRMAQVVLDLQEEVRRIRMLPVATVFQTLPRMIRDLSRQLGKEVDFECKGGDNEMDRSVIEQIGGPLVHLLRNCMDHGLESPEVRVAAGKPRKGSLVLSASQRGGSILLEMSDDGAGINAKKVKASAVAKGVITQEEAAAMSEREAIWLIFRSGVSTRAAVTDISGRGVGMDAVREVVERLNGIIDIETQVGKGTRFMITVPLTVATTLSLMVRAGNLVFALPVANVIRVVRVKPEQIGTASGRAVLKADGRHIALVSLAETLGVKSEPTNASSYLAIIVGFVEERMAFIVDSVMGTQEVMAKHLPKPLYKVPFIAGATILGTGEVVIILNPADMTRGVQNAGFKAHTPTEAQRPSAVLIVDDSLTVRTMEKTIVEGAGYSVSLANDGQDAWELLQNNKFDIIVSDVNMPRMDGFELTRKVRSDARLKDTPVVLVTSLSSSEDREKGIKAGADAHIVKSVFEQEKLLETIRSLI